MLDEFIERRIITGMIVSTDYLREIHRIWHPRLMSAHAAVLIASWCMNYYDKYNKSPGRDIQNIYLRKLKAGRIKKEEAELIEIALEGLNKEFGRKKFNVQYLLDETYTYFKEQYIRTVKEDLESELADGNIIEAEKIIAEYVPLSAETGEYVNPFSTDPEMVHNVFAERSQSLVTFPKALGEFWNLQFTRDSFIALMAPEKRGKTFMLMEIAVRGVLEGSNVVFFQAGDMSERQQLRRLYIYLAKRSDRKKYCQRQTYPVVDCIKNVTDICRSKDRECDGGCEIFDGRASLKTEHGGYNIKAEELINLYQENKSHKPCRNCRNFKGTIWLAMMRKKRPLQVKTALRALRRFNKLYPGRLKLCTYPNETLAVSEIKSLLTLWEKKEEFIPDVVVIDYADILAPDADCRRLDFRHQQNKVWQRLRSLSQEKHCLVVTATQASARSYKKGLMQMTDFSEDKRKFAHVTAMYGLNQTDEEKQLGILRINELVVRDGESNNKNQVWVLQHLQSGQPYLGSFF